LVVVRQRLPSSVKVAGTFPGLRLVVQALRSPTLATFPRLSKEPPVTHCRWNHEYAPQNTRIRRDGKRVCRQCERDRARRYATARGDRPGRRASMRKDQRERLAARRQTGSPTKSCAVRGSRERLEIDRSATKIRSSKGRLVRAPMWPCGRSSDVAERHRPG
jgi:hypothetical protein